MSLAHERARERDKSQEQSQTTLYQTGQPVTAAIDTHMRRRYGERKTMTEVSIVTKEDAQLAQNDWGKSFGPLFNQQSTALQLAHLHKTGFNPGHIDLVHGNLFVNIKGLEWHARQKLGNTFGAVAQPIVLEGAEKTARGGKDHEIAVLVNYYGRHPATGNLELEMEAAQGFGRASTVKGKEVIAGSSVEAQHPYKMAVKRAKAELYREIAPIGIDIGVADDGYEIAPATVTVEETPRIQLEEPEAEEVFGCSTEDCDEIAVTNIDGMHYCSEHSAAVIASTTEEDATPDTDDGQKTLEW
jgi:hypothetical protein